jgi:rod shape-determining protein MreC
MLLLLLSFVFYLSNRKAVRDHNAFDRVVLTLSSPVQWVVVQVLDAVDHFSERYIFLFNAQNENALLKEENSKLRAELSHREEQRLENDRLRLLVGMQESVPDVKMIYAEVLASSPSPLFRSVRVNRGSDQGIAVGEAVITYDGVVGRIAAVSPGYADVMLLVDPNSSTDVLVQRTRARARVRGVGDDHMLGIEIEHLTRTADIEPGDLLVTSGVGKVFPKGLPVGRVLSIERTAFGLYQHASVRPSVDFSELESVMVVTAGWPRESNFEHLSSSLSEDLLLEAKP